MAKRKPTFSQRSRAIGSAEKAAFHHVTGAGRSKVKRPFFDVNESDIDALIDRLDRALTRRIEAR